MVRLWKREAAWLKTARPKGRSPSSAISIPYERAADYRTVYADGHVLRIWGIAMVSW